MIENMFDDRLPGPDRLADVDAGGLVEALAGWAQVEAAAAARRLAVIAEITARRLSDSGACSRWACDGWDAAAAEVAAAMNITHAKASRQMYLATALRNRLPKVAALLADGLLDAALVASIVWHTTLIEDAHTLAVVDGVLAGDALRYGALSMAKTVGAIQAVIEVHDPEALRRTQNAARSRDLVVDTADTESGTSSIWGRLYAHDALALDQRLSLMAHGVCDDDPRTIAQRRADALGVLAAGGQQLRCACDSPDCPTPTRSPAPGAPLVYVLADTASLNTAVDQKNHGQTPRHRRPATEPSSHRKPRTTPDTQPPAVPGQAPEIGPPAQILGGPLIPASVLADLIRAGATIRALTVPLPRNRAERRYRPSAALAAYIYCRDQTCRFPHCDRPAQVCDIDHATPYANGGLTHPTNLRLLCRKHHLLKTFWGWRDRQHPDGTIDWISPTGQTYTTHPGSRLTFPALCRDTVAPHTSTSTGQLNSAPSDPRTLMMPTRRRTRAQNRRQKIKAERALNKAPPD